uniref:FAD/NAD(P)-binding domain-containing protein n=1 Tax=Kwoniella bestiolae CBS 10118 TaxID=1296100 RepID=A0A1B9GAH2_9TREE|nr:hypothetical protein I302_02868 [Kwoniella bestiolae CBS 10118]OCF28017.1 hypothetical protein I302_02868 [Kwoniella bestiolae CBS 10118]
MTASIAGHECVNRLVPHLPSHLGIRVLLIDARSFAWWPITILRAVVVPGWEDKITIPLSTERVFKADSPHRVIAGNKVLELREGSVVLERPFEGSEEVPFFRCVIATGASQTIPTMPGWSQTEKEFIDSLRRSQRKIESAKRVVVVGGGAVGVEIAGEIAAHHPHKSVTIVHKDCGLLAPTPPNDVSIKIQKGGSAEVKSYFSPPTDPRLSVELGKICDKLGIAVILNDRVIIPIPTNSSFDDESKDNEVHPDGHFSTNTDGRVSEGDKVDSESKSIEWDGTFGLQPSLVTLRLESGKTLQADYVYPGCGVRPNSKLVGEVDEGALDDGLIRVDEYLKVTSTSHESIFKGQYYAIGDVCSCPGFKLARTAFVNASKTAGNIISEIKGKSPSKYSVGAISHLDLPLGPDEGAGMTNFGWLGTWVFGSKVTTRIRGKTSGTERFFAGRFRGEKKSEIVFD